MNQTGFVEINGKLYPITETIDEVVKDNITATLSYEQKVVSFIRERYSIDQELAILRQRYTKPDEFAEYNTYCEWCKSKAKQ